MSEKYLLPCVCGQMIPVEQRQAGTTVTCTCGKILEVPTIRGFAKLSQVGETKEDLPPIWGLRQGLVFLGLVIALPAFAFAIFLYSQLPTLNENNIEHFVKQLSPVESWALWRVYSEGMPKAPTPDTQAVIRSIQATHRQIYGGLILGVIGLLVSAWGFFLVKRPGAPDQQAQRKPSRKK